MPSHADLSLLMKNARTRYVVPWTDSSDAYGYWMATTTTTTPSMTDTNTMPKLSADEKLIVQALKSEKPQSEIAMLITVARLTGRTPAAVMEVLDDVAALVKEKVGGELPAKTT